MNIELALDRNDEPLGPGDRVWLMACWVNDRGARDPWSEPVRWRMSYGQLSGGVGAARQAA